MLFRLRNSLPLSWSPSKLFVHPTPGAVGALNSPFVRRNQVWGGLRRAGFALFAAYGAAVICGAVIVMSSATMEKAWGK